MFIYTIKLNGKEIDTNNIVSDERIFDLVGEEDAKKIIDVVKELDIMAKKIEVLPDVIIETDYTEEVYNYVIKKYLDDANVLIKKLYEILDKAIVGLELEKTNVELF